MAADVILVDNVTTSILEVSQVVGSPIEVEKVDQPLIEVDVSNVIHVELPQPVLFIDVEVGIPGPPGPSGSEESVKYTKLVDFVGTDVIYRGEAIPGTIESAPGWRIRKIEFINGDITDKWAEGNANFDKVWADRLTYTYA